MNRDARVFEMACLRKILGVTWLDKLHNTKIRDNVNYHEEIQNLNQKTQVLQTHQENEVQSLPKSATGR